MKYVTHELKGTHNYIKYQTVFEIIKTIILYAMALGIFFIGYFTLGTKKNLWTVIAVLALLPASKALVGVIMFLRFKSLSNEQYDVLSNAIGDIPSLYENILTTSEKSYYLSAIIYAKGSLIGFMPDKKSSADKITKHLNAVLKNGGHKEVNVKIFNNIDDFISRCNKINDSYTKEELVGAMAIFNTIKAVSL